MQKLRHLDGIGYLSFFYALVAFILGGYLAIDLLSPLSLLVVLSALPFLYSAWKKGKGNVLIFFASFALGVGVFSIRLPVTEGKGSHEGFVIQAKSNYFLFLEEGRRYYVYEKANTREFGDYLSIDGRVSLYETTEYESRFSFKDYLAKEGVLYQLTAYTITPKFKAPLRYREKQLAFLSHFSKEGQDALDALLFDHKDYSSSFIQKASSLGCLYFLSTSGVLYGAALRGSDYLFGLALKKEKECHIISWLFALLLLPLGFYKAGFWRVFLSRSYRLIHEMKGARCPPNFFVLSFLGCLSLLVNRYRAFDTGFLLGYGLAFSLSLSSELLSVYPGKRKKLMTSLFVLFFLFPMLAGKGALHFFSLFYSILLLPLVYPFAFLGLVSYLSVPLVSFLNGYAQLLGNIVSGMEKIDLVIPLGDWSGLFVYGYYAFFAIFYYFRDIGAYIHERILLGGLVGVIVLETIPFMNPVSQQVSFINVGQGDAILIRDGSTSVMIDTGGNTSFDLAQEVDIPFLRKNQIYKLDCLIASHGDYDHIGASTSLSEHFAVKRYVNERSEFPLTIGSLTFTNYNLWGGSEENEESLVLGLDFMGKKWLFTGDAPMAIEEKILAQFPTLDCDILKVGHHGSDTSSSSAFLKAITPEVGIVSVGAKNKYGHPSEATLERFKALGIPLRRTDEEGTITYKSYFSRKLPALSS